MDIFRVGLVIIEESTNSVLLFLNHNWNAFSDLGGKIAENESVIMAVKRETHEESAGAIDIDEHLLTTYMDFVSEEKRYITYFVSVDTIDLDHFDTNLEKLLKRDDVYESWKETIKYKKFKIDDLLKTYEINSKCDNGDIIDNDSNEVFYSITLKSIFEFINNKNTPSKCTKLYQRNNNIFEIDILTSYLY